MKLKNLFVTWGSNFELLRLFHCSVWLYDSQWEGNTLLLNNYTVVKSSHVSPLSLQLRINKLFTRRGDTLGSDLFITRLIIFHRDFWEGLGLFTLLPNIVKYDNLEASTAY